MASKTPLPIQSTSTTPSYRKDKAILAARPWKYEQNRHGYREHGGWLRKATRKGQWKRRWFRVQASYLVYYKSPTSQKPLGFLDLRDITSVRRCYGQTKGKTTTQLAAAASTDGAGSAAGASSTSPTKGKRRIELSNTSPAAPPSPSSPPPPPSSSSSSSSSSSTTTTTGCEDYLVLGTKVQLPIVLIVESDATVGSSEPSTAKWYKVLSITLAAVSGADRQASRNTTATGRWTHNWHVESVALCDELLRTWVAGSEGKKFYFSPLIY